MIIPGNLSDVADMVATLGKILQTTGTHPPHLMPPPPLPFMQPPPAAYALIAGDES